MIRFAEIVAVEPPEEGAKHPTLRHNTGATRSACSVIRLDNRDFHATLLFGNAVEVSLPAEKQFAARDRSRGAEAVVEPVDRQHLG